MKTFRLLLIAFITFITMDINAQTVLPAGSTFTVQLDQTITKKSKKGEIVKLHVVSDVLADGVVVIPQNSFVEGEVIKAKSGVNVLTSQKTVTLAFKLKTVELPDGSKINLNGNAITKEGKGNTIGAARIFEKKKVIEIEAGETFTASTIEDFRK